MPELRRQLPPLGTLIAFEAAARLRSFTAAGAELHLSQAAISRQIRSLEANLGVQLFQRQRYSVSLSPAGEGFYRVVAPLLQELAGAADDIRPKPQQSLTVYSDPSLAGALLIPRLGQFAQRHPGLQWHVVSSNQPIENYPHPLDLGLQTGHWPQRRFRVVDIADDAIFPVCAPQHPLATVPEVAAPDLAHSTLLHLSDSPRQWLDWRGFLGRFSVPIDEHRGSMHFTTYSDMLDATEQGYGVALGWGFSVVDRLQRGSLVRLGPLSVPLSPGLCAYLPLGTPSPLVEGLLSWLQASLVSVVPS